MNCDCTLSKMIMKGPIAVVISQGAIDLCIELSRGVKESTLDSESQGPEFESQWGPSPGIPCHPIRSDLECSAGSAPVSTGCCDSPEDFTGTVQARLAVADGP
ncbi:hypothetical protein WISP_79014 [Willisornis vidua]|uniref:Uncharacterized protein n=1 Tax=Willisornis vidua TaxID=1566151 RepID=A0ABQ9DAB7_9PASS|nr:hypothetical protein WISP_79014 [Willisornis vidua]